MAGPGPIPADHLPTFDPGFTTPEMTAVFAPAARVRSMLSFEAALAEAESAAGLIPVSAAAEIARACAGESPDPATILAATWRDGSPVIALVAWLGGQMDAESARWVHYGATTQDVVDTALMLQVRDGFALLERESAAVAVLLASLASTHRTTPMMARTFLQHALPTTFGMRVGQWLEPLLRSVSALREGRADLPVQLGGPVGHLSDLGQAGPEIVEAVAQRLGLAAPPISWPTDRSRVASVVGLTAGVAALMGKIASDLALLASSDIAAVTMRDASSSSMPHKRNPIDAVRAVAAAAACAASAGAMRGERGHELERGLGGWHIEWLAIPLVFHTAAAAVAGVQDALTGLEVNTERMAADIGDIDPTTVQAAAVWIDRVLIEASRVLGAS